MNTSSRAPGRAPARTAASGEIRRTLVRATVVGLAALSSTGPVSAGAAHVDRYDREDRIPWARLGSFFIKSMAKGGGPAETPLAKGFMTCTPGV